MNFFSKLFGKGRNNTLKVASFGKLRFLEVDMHNHLLPGIDDGAESLEQSLALISSLNVLGLTKFISTPHIIQDVHPNTKNSIDSAHQKLCAHLERNNNPSTIYAAAEHMVDEGIDRLIDRDELCVMPGGYVLIEMSYLAPSHGLFKTILDIQNLGYKPILAHPERYNYYHFEFEMYKKIKDAGCLLQLNLLSISRYYGVDVKSTALTLIKSGMYDFVGTDLHHQKHLRALEHVVEKYPLQDVLKTCKILNPTLLDHLHETEAVRVG
ncbi:tyrosine-protein phosphatase [Sphingobacterium haloxyli]|uniref:protein-tyrosine-phosphatase n=1 Tax=Sphingobacterium haloxyli TaxID=2100533 RepID=A0A2S9J2I8_9SPHI|nr:CpsB/CapC family capsule biosynthesis tyrosine phosphatase [Sphingobacterium haloxyli]PRD46954.1 protein tyrosine phosphatase [Sphingobacterium haloxyli]